MRVVVVRGDARRRGVRQDRRRVASLEDQSQAAATGTNCHTALLLKPRRASRMPFCRQHFEELRHPWRRDPMRLPDRGSKPPADSPESVQVQPLLGVDRSQRRPAPMNQSLRPGRSPPRVSHPHVPSNGATRRTGTPSPVQTVLIIPWRAIQTGAPPMASDLMQCRLPGPRDRPAARPHPRTPSLRPLPEELVPQLGMAAVAPTTQAASQRPHRRGLYHAGRNESRTPWAPATPRAQPPRRWTAIPTEAERNRECGVGQGRVPILWHLVQPQAAFRPGPR